MGLVLAIVGLGAILVPAAQAKFYYSAEHTILTGAQTTANKFTAAEGFAPVTCTTVEFSGTAAGEEAESQVIAPTFSGCSDSLGRQVDIDDSGFSYELTESGEVHLTGALTLTITNGSKSVVCTDVISSPQTDKGITYENLGGTSGEELEFALTNVANTTSGGLLNCGVSNGTHTSGSYVGHAVITGKDTEGNAAEVAFSAGNVELSLSAPTFHVGEELQLTATNPNNPGNVSWKLFSESFDIDEKSWDPKSGEVCNPTSRQPGQSCTVKVKCTAAGKPLIWTVKVESEKLVLRKETLKVICDP